MQRVRPASPLGQIHHSSGPDPSITAESLGFLQFGIGWHFLPRALALYASGGQSVRLSLDRLVVFCPERREYVHEGPVKESE